MPSQESSTWISWSSNSDGSPASLDEDATHSAVIDLRSRTRDSALSTSAISDWQIVELDELNGLADLSLTLTDRHLLDPDLLPNNIHTVLPSPLSIEISHPLNVFTALFRNGQILSQSCNVLMASKSPPPSPLIPVPLRPTVTQLNVVHFTWLNTLPFSKLRDSLIRLQSVVNLDDFLNDFFVAPSFTIRGGAESWDPWAWSMEEAWAEMGMVVLLRKLVFMFGTVVERDGGRVLARTIGTTRVHSLFFSRPQRTQPRIAPPQLVANARSSTVLA